MTVWQAVVVATGSVSTITAMIVMMNRVVRNEVERMARRRQEWIDSGADPDEEPNFYSGPSGSPT
jgi:hypothetical protein